MDPISSSRVYVNPGIIQRSGAPCETGQLITDQFQLSGTGGQDMRGGEMPAPDAAPLSEVDGETKKAAFPRPMTGEEKKNFKEYFPALDVDNAVVSAAATPQYNCISWTVGETHQWFWPPDMYPNLDPEAAFDKFYGNYGLTQAPPGQEGEVAHWSGSDGPTHGSISGPDHGPRWESKCGEELRIQHGRDELEGEIYGKISKYYCRKEGQAAVQPGRPLEVPQDVKAAVREKAEAVPESTREEFKKNYDEWLSFRKSPRIRMSSNPSDYCKSGSFDRIVSMGSSAVPLLMEKIASGDFFSFQAFDAIQKADETQQYRIGGPAKAEDAAVSEQTRAQRALLDWHKGII